VSVAEDHVTVWEQAAEGLTAAEREQLEDAVEKMVDAFKTLSALRGNLYTAAFLVSMGRKWDSEFNRETEREVTS
jgi:hypothetical protein